MRKIKWHVSHCAGKKDFIMNKLYGIVILLSVLSMSPLIAVFQFVEEESKRTLYVVDGTQDDRDDIKEMSFDILSTSCQIREEFKELQKQRFVDNCVCVVATEEYQFYLVYDASECVGFALFQVSGRYVYGIDVHVKGYDIQGVTKGFVKFIKQELAPEAEYFITAASKLDDEFDRIFLSCGFEPIDFSDPILAAIAKPSEHAPYYQAYKLKL